MMGNGTGANPGKTNSNEENPVQAEPEEGTFSLLAVGLTLARNKRRIALTTALCTIVGVVISLSLPRYFTASTRIMTPQQSQSSAMLMASQLASSGGAGSLAAAAGTGFGLKNPNDLYIGLLKSRPIAENIANKFNLLQVYHEKSMSRALARLDADTMIASEKSGLIQIAVTDKDKDRAAAMANEYTEQLRAMSKRLALTEAAQRRMFYEEQLKHAKDDLLAAEVSLKQVEQQKGLVQPDAQVKAVITGLADLHAKIAAKQVELEAIRSYSTEGNPDVKLVEKELSALRGQAATLESRSGSSGLPGLQDVAGSGIDYLKAEHEVQYRQMLFDLLIKQYDAARLDEAKDGALVQVIEPAVRPDRAAFPHRMPIVLGFLLLGFAGACIYLPLQELIRSRPEVYQAMISLRSALLSK